MMILKGKAFTVWHQYHYWTPVCFVSSSWAGGVVADGGDGQIVFAWGGSH